jgi:hypothetical protein
MALKRWKLRNTRHLSRFGSLSTALVSHWFVGHEREEKEDERTDAAPGGALGGVCFTSTGLMHACPGVIKSLRSVKVCIKYIRYLLFRLHHGHNTY